MGTNFCVPRIGMRQDFFLQWKCISAPWTVSWWSWRWISFMIGHLFIFLSLTLTLVARATGRLWLPAWTVTHFNLWWQITGHTSRPGLPSMLFLRVCGWTKITGGTWIPNLVLMKQKLSLDHSIKGGEGGIMMISVQVYNTPAKSNMYMTWTVSRDKTLYQNAEKPRSASIPAYSHIGLHYW